MASKPLKDLVVYHNGHFLRGGNPLKHAERIERFLAECTCGIEWIESAIHARAAPEYDARQSKALIKAFNAKWGRAQPPPKGLEHLGAQFPYSWTPDLSFEQMLEVVMSHMGPRQSPLPMLAVHFTARFRLKDPATGKPLPNQNWSRKTFLAEPFFQPHGFSEIWSDLGEASTLGALISFPFAANDPAFKEYLAHFQRHFPTQLSSKSSNWHWWAVRQDGSKHYRKAAVPAMGGAGALKKLASRADAG